MTEHLRAPGFADQIVVLKDAAMSLEFCSRLECENKMFMPEAHKLSKVTIAGRGMIK